MGLSPTHTLTSYRNIPEVLFDPSHRHYAVAILNEDHDVKPPVDHQTMYLRTAPSLQQAHTELRETLKRFGKKNLAAGCGELRVTEGIVAIRPLDKDLTSALRGLGILALYAKEHLPFYHSVVLARLPTEKLFKSFGIEGELVGVSGTLAENLLSQKSHIACSCLPIPARTGDQRWFSFGHSPLLTCDMLNYAGGTQLANFNLIKPKTTPPSSSETPPNLRVVITHPLEGPPLAIVREGADMFRDHDKASHSFFFDGSVTQLVQGLIQEECITSGTDVTETLSRIRISEQGLLKRCLDLF